MLSPPLGSHFLSLSLSDTNKYLACVRIHAHSRNLVINSCSFSPPSCIRLLSPEQGSRDSHIGGSGRPRRFVFNLAAIFTPQSFVPFSHYYYFIITLQPDAIIPVIFLFSWLSLSSWRRGDKDDAVFPCFMY